MRKLKVEVLFPTIADLSIDEKYEYPFEEKYKLLSELRQLCNNTLFDLYSYLETSFQVEIKIVFQKNTTGIL